MRARRGRCSFPAHSTSGLLKVRGLVHTDPPLHLLARRRRKLREKFRNGLSHRFHLRVTVNEETKGVVAFSSGLGKATASGPSKKSSHRAYGQAKFVRTIAGRISDLVMIVDKRDKGLRRKSCRVTRGVLPEYGCPERYPYLADEINSQRVQSW